MSWCRTRRASSGPRRRAARGPPRSPAPSGWPRTAPGAGCSSPAPHLHTDTSVSEPRRPRCGEDDACSCSVLTVENREDFLHHLPQDEDVGLRVRRSSGFPVLAVLAGLAEVALLVFGMSGCCGDILQTRNSCNRKPNMIIIAQISQTTQNPTGVAGISDRETIPCCSTKNSHQGNSIASLRRGRWCGNAPLQKTSLLIRNEGKMI